MEVILVDEVLDVALHKWRIHVEQMPQLLLHLSRQFQMKAKIVPSREYDGACVDQRCRACTYNRVV